MSNGTVLAVIAAVSSILQRGVGAIVQIEKLKPEIIGTIKREHFDGNGNIVAELAETPEEIVNAIVQTTVVFAAGLQAAKEIGIESRKKPKVG